MGNLFYRKARGKRLDCVSCVSLHFFRALAASYVLYFASNNVLDTSESVIIGETSILSAYKTHATISLFTLTKGYRSKRQL